MTLKEIIDSVISDIKEAVYSSKTLNAIGKLQAGNIKKRTRAGLGYNRSNGATVTGLKPLKPSTIKRRKTLQGQGKLSPETTPSTSNLTESGKMLDDLTWKPKSDGVDILFSTERSSRVASNSNPRYFMAVTKEDRDEISKLISERIVNALKNK